MPPELNCCDWYHDAAKSCHCAFNICYNFGPFRSRDFVNDIVCWWRWTHTVYIVEAFCVFLFLVFDFGGFGRDWLWFPKDMSSCPDGWVVVFAKVSCMPNTQDPAYLSSLPCSEEGSWNCSGEQAPDLWTSLLDTIPYWTLAPVQCDGHIAQVLYNCSHVAIENLVVHVLQISWLSWFRLLTLELYIKYCLFYVGKIYVTWMTNYSSNWFLNPYIAGLVRWSWFFRRAVDSPDFYL